MKTTNSLHVAAVALFSLSLLIFGPSFATHSTPDPLGDQAHDLLIVESQATSRAQPSGSDEDATLIVNLPAETATAEHSQSRIELLKQVDVKFRPQLEHLTDSEIEVFLKKRQKYLGRLEAFFTKLRISPNLIGKAKDALEMSLFESASGYARQTGNGPIHFAIAQAGLGLNTEFVTKLRQRKLGRILPKSGGYFFLIGLGYGLKRHFNENTQKYVWTLDFYTDISTRVKSVETFMSHASVDLLTIGIDPEARKLDPTKVFHKGSKESYARKVLPVGVTVSNSENHVWLQYPVPLQFITHVQFPPILPAFSYYETEGTIYRLFSINLSRVKEVVKSGFIRSLMTMRLKPRPILCRAAI